MHIPDGYINLATSAGAAAVAAGSVGSSLRRAGRSLQERQIPLAGLSAAFIFALQMLNFPVVAGTSGHLLGGALAVILLGPAMGITVVAVVIVVQALMFADGGLSALGLNIVNMAVVTGVTGWVVFRGLMVVLPKRTSPALGASLVAGWSSVVASAAVFSIEYALGGVGGADPNLVFRAMTGVHALIGIGEGVITTTVLGAVMATRPDLVYGIRVAGIRPEGSVSLGRRSLGGFVAGGVAAALLLVFAVAPFASRDPDGLLRVAEDTGIAQAAGDAGAEGPLAGYTFLGIDGGLATGLAGAAGILSVFGLGASVVAAARRRRRSDPPVRS